MIRRLAVESWLRTCFIYLFVYGLLNGCILVVHLYAIYSPRQARTLSNGLCSGDARGHGRVIA